MYYTKNKKIHHLLLNRKAKKDLQKIPSHISVKLQAWVSCIGEIGWYKTSKLSGFRDEALKGPRKKQRSIRLNRSYRAIYKIRKCENLDYIEILDITNHEY